MAKTTELITTPMNTVIPNVRPRGSPRDSAYVGDVNVMEVLLTIGIAVEFTTCIGGRGERREEKG